MVVLVTPSSGRCAQRRSRHRVRLPRLLLVVERYQSLLFFFQAEDGIRDYKVTGVQTCALPIYLLPDLRALATEKGSTLDQLRLDWVEGRVAAGLGDHDRARDLLTAVRQAFLADDRSEERRVGKECRSRWSPYH